MGHPIFGHAMLLAAAAPLVGGCAPQARIERSPAAAGETADRVAIEQLVIEYSYLLDHGRATELAALFTPDGVLEIPNLRLQAVGREAIADYYARRAGEPRTTRHISTNLRLVFDTPDRATGTRTILYYRGDGAGPPFPAEPGSVGEYVELFARGADGRWRFASRRSSLLFSGRKRGDAGVSDSGSGPLPGPSRSPEAPALPRRR